MSFEIVRLLGGDEVGDEVNEQIDLNEFTNLNEHERPVVVEVDGGKKRRADMDAAELEILANLETMIKPDWMFQPGLLEPEDSSELDAVSVSSEPSELADLPAMGGTVDLDV